MAETLKLEQPWEQVKEKLKEAKIELTDEDLQYSAGQEEELFDRVAQKLKKSREEVKEWIESVSSNKAQAG